MAGCGDSGCKVEIGDLPLLTGCPGANEWYLVGNAVGGLGKDKYARRLVSDLINCINSGIFGIGILTITGAQLDSENTYYNSDLINDLVVFYNGMNRFLLYSTEWEYVLNVDNNVIGVKILLDVTFTSEDVFLIFPNPQPV